MQITPLEIRKHPFRTVMFRGFEPDQVNSFLQQVASEVEELRRENSSLASSLKAAESDLARYRRIEETLNETLLTAQRATDDARANAHKEAELIMKDAQVRADRYEQESLDRVRSLQTEIRSLELQKDGFLRRFRSLLSEQSAFLEAMAASDLPKEGSQ